MDRYTREEANGFSFPSGLRPNRDPDLDQVEQIAIILRMVSKGDLGASSALANIKRLLD